VDDVATSRRARVGVTRPVVSPRRIWISASYKATLVTQIQNVISAGGGNAAAPKLRGFISAVQSATTAQITPAYKTLLLNWANDLLGRL
jgi:hypothetical protein